MINSIPLRIAVTGVTGRMGKKVIQCIQYQKNKSGNNKIILGAAIVKKKSVFCGMNINRIDQSNTSGLVITDDLALVEKKFDILIDFTTPKATIEYLNFCVTHHKNMIIGTTGLDKSHLSLIKNASKKIGIVYSANFSIGITMMFKLLEETSKNIGNIVDIDIVEIHHNKKNDVPSGTALRMYEIIKKNIIKVRSLCNDMDHVGCNSYLLHDKSNNDLSCKSNRDVAIHSIRSGDIIGEHTVLFSGSRECLEIKHKAFDRSIFANGALYSALWLRDKKIGLFDLNSVLGFDTF